MHGPGHVDKGGHVVIYVITGIGSAHSLNVFVGLNLVPVCMAARGAGIRQVHPDAGVRIGIGQGVHLRRLQLSLGQ